MTGDVPQAPLLQCQLHPIRQTALVVQDLAAACRFWWQTCRLGPWTGYLWTPAIMSDMHLRGQPARFSFRNAFAWRDGAQMELIEPLGGGSLFAEHLARHGPGLHHLGIYVTDIVQGRTEMEAQGFRAVQGAAGFGADGDGCFCYFESDRPGSTLIELIQAPATRRAPAFVFPDAEATQPAQEAAR
jgi:catechol 2,3-dioxygenase-like lactoylglutathione lyase family enzyme